VVVIVEPRLGQLLRLMRLEHAERHAGLQPHGADALHDCDDLGHVAVLGIAPRRAHAEPLGARILGLRRALENFLHVHQLGRLNAAIGMDRLRAIAAILGATAGLDGEQGAQLDLFRRVIVAVDAGGAKDEFGEGEVEEVRDFLAGPVGADFSHFFFRFAGQGSLPRS